MSLHDTLHDRLRDVRWWYRTTVGEWIPAPGYVDCPNCYGRVFHARTDDELITYRCRRCPWTRHGTVDLEFYREQRPDGADRAAYETLAREIDVGELERVLAADGAAAVEERVRDGITDDHDEADDVDDR